MEGSESSINRIGRTIWTVWGYVSGAVGRYLRPEGSTSDEAEEAAAGGTVRSYRDLRENEEEKERSEAKAWAQSERPHGGVRVRAAAVQWERASVGRGGTGGTGRQAGTGAAGNPGLQEQLLDGVDKKAQEQRESEETSDNNNEAVRTKGRDLDGERSEIMIDSVLKRKNAKKAITSNESAGQGLNLEDHRTNKCPSGEEENLPELPEERKIKGTEDQDENQTTQDEQRKRGMTEVEDEADGLVPQLACLAKEKGDRLKATLDKELKVVEKQKGETTESKFGKEAIDAKDEATKRGTEGTVKDGQFMAEKLNREGVGTVGTSKELEPITATAENETAPTREREPNKAIMTSKQVTIEILKDDQQGLDQTSNDYEVAEETAESKSTTLDEFNKNEICGTEPETTCKIAENSPSPTPERGTISVSKESKQVTVGTIEDGLQVTESKCAERFDLDESPAELSEGRAKTERDFVEEPVTEHTTSAENNDDDLEPKGIDNEEASTLEEESIQVNEESKPETVGSVEEFMGSETTDKLESNESQLDGFQTPFTKGMVDTECEPLEEPASGQMENVVIYEKEPEPIGKSSENEAEIEPASTPEREPVRTKISMQEALGTMEGEQHEAHRQLSGSKFDETVGIFESDSEETSTQFNEGGTKAEYDLLEEPMMGHLEAAEVYEEDLEPKGTDSKAAPTLEDETIRVIEESKQVTTKQDKTQTPFSERTVKADLEPSEEPNEICENDPDPFSKITENKAEMEPASTEREPRNVIMELKEATLGTMEEEQHEASGAELGETLNIHESKLVESQTERDLLEEPMMVLMEVAEVYEEDLEPTSLGVENEEAAVLSGDACEIVVTAKCGPHQAEQELLEFIGSDMNEKQDIHVRTLRETQSDLSEGLWETTAEPSTKACSTKMMLNEDSVEFVPPKEKTDAGTTSEEDLETKVAQLGDTVSDLFGSQLPDVASEQDSESVITLVAEGPRNQSETTEFRKEARTEVAAAAVKKFAEMERSLDEQPTAREQFALQETVGQSILKQGSLQEISAENQILFPEKQFSNMERGTSNTGSDHAEQAGEPARESAGEPAEEPVDEMPSSSPQELAQIKESIAMSVTLGAGLPLKIKTSFTAQKVEVLEANPELRAACDLAETEVWCEKAGFEPDASEMESESTHMTVETLETIRGPEASVPDDACGCPSLLNLGEWTVQDGSAAQPHGHQMGFSGELSLPGRESSQETSEEHKDEQKAWEGAESETQVRAASLGFMEDVMRELKQEFEDKQSSSSGAMDVHKNTKQIEEHVGRSEHSSAFVQMHSEVSDHTVQDRQNPVEAVDVGREACGTTESTDDLPQNTTGDDVHLHSEEDVGGFEEKAGGEKPIVGSEESFQQKCRPGLKRGFETMARDEEDKPPAPKDWAGASLVLQQVSALDCTVQKSKIAVKNPLVRPPKDPRTLINKASVEPLAPARPSQPSPLRQGPEEGPSVPQKGVVGFKLPGLGAGFPALRKTDAGRKIRDEGAVESGSAQSLPVQKLQTEPKEDGVQPEQPVSKPKWTPPRHPGMGNPMMMSELKNKLKRTGKE